MWKHTINMITQRGMHNLGVYLNTTHNLKDEVFFLCD